MRFCLFWTDCETAKICRAMVIQILPRELCWANQGKSNVGKLQGYGFGGGISRGFGRRDFKPPVFPSTSLHVCGFCRLCDMFSIVFLVSTKVIGTDNCSMEMILWNNYRLPVVPHKAVAEVSRRGKLYQVHKLKVSLRTQKKNRTHAAVFSVRWGSCAQFVMWVGLVA